MVTPYTRPQVTRGAVPVVEQERSPFQAEERQEVAADQGDFQRQSAGLKAVQTDQFKKIPLDAVLHDFQSTMDALGADEQTRSEVVTYLQVVGLQGSKEKPEVPFMRQTLRTAAGTLDQFITNALGQPSQVVKEWVDALLLQDIDYQLTEQPDWLKKTPASSVENAQNAEQFAEVSPPAFDEVVKSQLKALIDTSKTQFKQQNVEAADQSLQRALGILDTHDQPLWNGKVWQLRARFQDKSGNWEQAATAYEQAAQHFETSGRVDLQAESLHTAATILDEQGQYQRAAAHYQTVVTLDSQQGNPAILLNSLNDLGSLYLRQGDTGNAVSTLERATREFFNTPAEQTVQSDVLNNLGAAYRSKQDYDSAIQTFQQSLKLAQTIRDKTRYTSTLQQLAATYVENSQPELAMKALQQLTQLQNA
jgi:tetratricopeptide (TPR) repeat protein